MQRREISLSSGISHLARRWESEKKSVASMSVECTALVFLRWLRHSGEATTQLLDVATDELIAHLHVVGERPLLAHDDTGAPLAASTVEARPDELTCSKLTLRFGAHCSRCWLGVQNGELRAKFSASEAPSGSVACVRVRSRAIAEQEIDQALIEILIGRLAHRFFESLNKALGLAVGLRVVWRHANVADTFGVAVLSKFCRDKLRAVI